jgi:hypothetical protein
MKLKHNFKNLKVWQKAVELAVLVYEVTKSFPTEEKFSLLSQEIIELQKMVICFKNTVEANPY